MSGMAAGQGQDRQGRQAVEGLYEAGHVLTFWNCRKTARLLATLASGAGRPASDIWRRLT